ncbi:uncharacterized protein LOC110372088 isoform X1 [Helicoverpa armigera]|uniref:uncharacterized protein LOC110372088 isoform X1 n=2 Tax=Helicoverpa armigera TaxID=29058 RepID=UPI000B3A9EA8|nr:uncharacterized protein LOC110372088 [Helicoverpa armigera]PZC82243.1 hypothetical protein B5X24_HaOG210799 [Helicoverpa armigera]
MLCLKLQNKMKLLFDRLTEPNYVLDNYYADSLITKLSNCADPEVVHLNKAPLISDLISEALDHTDNAHNSVKVFITKVLAMVVQKELNFAKIFAKQGDRLRAGFKKICEPNVNPSIRVAYIEVALSIVSHSSGVAWLIETGVWKEILSLCYERTTVFVVRQIYKFMADFLWKLNDLEDDANIRIIINQLLEPISRYDFINVQSLNSQEEEEICAAIEPTVQTLLAVVGKEGRIENATMLMNMLIKEYKINSYLYIASERIRTDDMLLAILKLIFWLTIAKVFVAKPMLPGVLYSNEDFLEVAAFNFNVIQAFIQRRSATLVLDFCSSCNIIWNSMFKDKEATMWEEQTDQTRIKMRNQMLFVFLVPVLVFVTYGKPQSVLTDINIHDYIYKLLNLSCEYTAKAAFAMRDLTGELDTLSVILQCVKKLIHLKEHLNEEQANLAFQALFYVLYEYNPIDEYGDPKLDENFEDGEEKNLVMTYVMDNVLSLVANRNIHWQESCEILCLYNVVLTNLDRPNLSCKFVVVSLKVIALTVKKFLQPNLTLLMDSKPGTALHDLGKSIYLKMQDRHWEVRDTALELLQLCTEIAYIKFPSFQKQILENNLINLAATIAFNDYESYVQVSALKCIGAASRINVIWDQLIAEFPDMQERLLYILRHNEEGIVRKEACNVLCDLYQNIKMTPAFKQTLYEHMVSSALTDFHWEVQISALKFWKCVYYSLLSGQGMLDGNFPPVTFSRETRKIVTLNETEIQKRLIKILEELASIGCLTVFVTLLHEQTEVGIMDAALSIAQELYDILKRHNVPDFITPKEGDITSVNELLVHIKEEPEATDDSVDMIDGQTSDNVIEDILNADDVNLLANIYEKYMTLQATQTPPPLKPKVKLLRFASPYLFVNYVKDTDFKQIIEEKSKWDDGIRSLSSLLDDVLGIYEVNTEANSLDCY